MQLIPIQKINVFREDTIGITQPLLFDLPSDQAIQKILIVKWSSMGDVVISSAVMQDIFLAFPHAELHLNAMPPWQNLFAHDTRFKKIWMVDLRKSERGWRGIQRWLGMVKQEKYDLIIDLQTNDRTRFLLSLLRLSGNAPRYLLGNRPQFPYTIRQKSLPNAHVITLMRTALAAIGVATHTRQPVLFSSTQAHEQAANLLQQNQLQPKTFAIFLPGSHAAGQTKRWGVAHYTELAQKLHAQGVRQVVLVGGGG